YGVVSLFGFGIGVYDLNALESNSRFAQSSPAPPTYRRLATQAAQTSAGGALTFSPDAALTASGTTLTAFALRPSAGLTPVTKNLGDEAAPVTTLNVSLVDLPELNAIKALVSAGNRPFYGRFNSIARYDAGNIRYALVSGAQYGLLVLDVTTGSSELVDIVWAANGIYAVRAIGGHYATAVDGDGRSLLIDLARIDERSLPRVDFLFPTAAAALKGGVDDSRIVWQSDRPADAGGNGLGVTTLAPVGDPDTGLLYAGTLLSKFMRVQSAIDPHVSVMVNLGRGVLTEVPAIVPLGIAVPKTISDETAKLRPCATTGVDLEQPTACRENASLGVFRVEMTLPGSVQKALAADPEIAIESERIAGAISEQTQEPLPPAHLRRFRLMRVIRDTYPGAKNLRFQKGFNKFVSPWVVAIADQRASRRYIWAADADREDAGCFHCKLPPFVTPSNSFELYSNGRDLAVRPELGVYTSTPYAYLGDSQRLFARFGTIMADTVRPADALTAAQAPPVATGQLAETVYLHSGEVEVAAVDLDAGGRAGWNVVFDRDYRSRTLGGTALGRGWDSAIFKRLRALPTGDVEYRDGSGEVWLFRLQGNVYKAPAGYFMHLLHTEQGFTLIDQKRRMTYFDELGRVTKEADEFYKSDGKGNVIRYVYDANGRLASIIDPNERRTTLTYHTDAARDGLLKSIRDWRTRAREVTYDYDNARLTSVELPKLPSVTPKRVYTYDDEANLRSIIEPNEAPAGTPRVTFTYDALDRVSTQTWGTGESATFTFNPGIASVTDALKQKRDYTLKLPAAPADKLDWYSQDRAHVETLKELAVPTYSGAAFGALPPAPLEALAAPPVAPKTREYRYTYTAEGQLETSTLAGVVKTTYGFASAGPELGTIVSSVSTLADATAAQTGVTYNFNFRPGSALLDSMSANGLTVQRREPDRNLLNPKESNSSIETTSEYDATTGLPTAFASTGGTAPDGAGSKTTIQYPAAALTSIAPHKRGLPERVSEGTAALETNYDYPDEDTTSVTDSRGV
ncbi:MAG TPA: hypothetical protein VN181_04015, partial [Thermoanaerobaculia bacterium]|nr:hypothetical protein [Thermoanaerobaculia bacterium]